MKTHKFFLAVVLGFAVMMASCDKENDAPNPTNENQSISQIVGTAWVNEESGDGWIDDDGDRHSYTEIETIVFLNEKEGEIRNSLTVEGLPEEDYEESYPFTYTYQGANGTITATDDGITETLKFTIQGNTLKLEFTDEYYPTYFTKQ